MENNKETSSNLFTISYSGRELSCLVERKGNQLDVLIDNNMSAVLEIADDGTLRQVSGHELGDAVVAFIRKQVIEQVNDK
jgi:hypothetical protein